MPIHADHFRNVFNEEQICDLKTSLTETDCRSFELTINQCRGLLFDYAEEKEVSHPLNRKTRMA